MQDRRSLTIVVLLALLTLANTCENSGQVPVIVSPQAGQLLRNADAFVVEIDASDDVFDLSTLDVTLNGQGLVVTLGESMHTAVPVNGQVLTSTNEVVVSAQRRSDSRLGIRRVVFDWQSIPAAVSFNPDYVSEPPVAEWAEVEILDAAMLRQNAVLRARFGSNVSLPQQIPYRVDEQTVYILRDDGQGDDLDAGDGLYAARIDFDYDSYVLRKARSLIGLGTATVSETKQLFEGRELVVSEPIDVGASLSDILGQGKGGAIPLVPLPAMGASLDPEKALLVRDPEIVTDPDLTFDLCDIDGDGQMGNPDGAWTFKTLMTAMANQSGTGMSPELFVREWLRGWETDPSTGAVWEVNHDKIPSRDVAQILDRWKECPEEHCLPDLDRSPFRLLAIVNRLDLREAVGYGDVRATAGELRFVFGLVQQLEGPGGRGDDDVVVEPHELVDMIDVSPGGPIGGGGICGTRSMTVIFEYKVDAETCDDVLAYAEAWEELALLDEDDDSLSLAEDSKGDFKKALLAITDSVVKADASPGKPNGSAIGQVRTNEISLGDPWEMREFTLQDFRPIGPGGIELPVAANLNPHVLRLDTAKQTPDLDFARDQNDEKQRQMVDYINSDSEAICRQEHQVPLTIIPFVLGPGGLPPLKVPFLAGRADFFGESGQDPGSSLTHFSGPGIEDLVGSGGTTECDAAEIRFNFSSATCTGCHGADVLDPVRDPAFYHISPGGFDPVTGAPLSRFLTGTREDPNDPDNDCCAVPDPSRYGGEPQHFFDLARRARDMEDLLATQCVNLMVASRQASAFVH